jgi:hypothetical protein
MFVFCLSKLDEFETLNSDPYNSTMYKFAVASSTPVLFVETFERKEVIPLYHVQTTRDDAWAEVDENNDEVTIKIKYFFNRKNAKRWE